MEVKEIIKFNEKLKEPFKKVSFQEEGHLYTIEGENRKIKSVSSLMSYFYDPFETDEIATKYAIKRGFELQDVLLAWEGEGTIATTHGSRVHAFAEDYVRWKYFKIGERPIVFDKQSLAALQFIDDLPDYLIPVAIELVMYNPDYWYTGTADLILYNTKTKKYIIADWKTNDTIVHKGFFKKNPLLRINPKRKLVQDNLGKYSVQFSFYQILLEEAGFEIQGRVLVHLREDKDNKNKLYQTYKTQDLTEELRSFLDTKTHLELTN